MKRSMSMFGVYVLLMVQMSVTTAEAKEYTLPISDYYPDSLFVIAAAKGFFAEEGVPVKIIYYKDTGDWFNAIMYNKVDIGVPWVTTHLDFVFGGNKFVASGVVSYDMSCKWIAKPEITPQNLPGQNVGMGVDTFAYRWMLLDYLTANHLKLADVNIVIMTEEDLLQNFVIGRLKVVFLPGTLADEALAKGNGVVLTTSTQQQTFNTLLMSEQTYQAAAKEDLKKLYRALVKAMIWINNPANDVERLAILQKPPAGLEGVVFSGVDSLDALKRMQAVMPILKPEELYAANTTMVKDAYDRMKTVRIEMGLPADVDYDSIVNTSVFVEVLKEQGLVQNP